MKVWYSRVGEWVVSGNKRLTEEGILLFFFFFFFFFFFLVYVCTSGVFDGVKVVLN